MKKVESRASDMYNVTSFSKHMKDGKFVNMRPRLPFLNDGTFPRVDIRAEFEHESHNKGFLLRLFWVLNSRPHARTGGDTNLLSVQNEKTIAQIPRRGRERAPYYSTWRQKLLSSEGYGHKKNGRSGLARRRIREDERKETPSSANTIFHLS